VLLLELNDEWLDRGRVTPRVNVQLNQYDRVSGTYKLIVNGQVELSA
jgi:hypothetical protein